jgi:hypothetical protein
MATFSPCPACLSGDHANHVYAWQPAPEPIIDGWFCDCKGDCTPPDMSEFEEWFSNRSRTKETTGVIPEPRGIIKILTVQVERYRNANLSVVDLDGFIQRVARQLDKACWCDENVCCQVHGKHTTPHKRCILR